MGNSKCKDTIFFSVNEKKRIFASKMTRVGYWIKAQTQYGVHSPFVFEMYRKVLFARVDKGAYEAYAAQLPAEVAANRRDRRYVETVYKLQDYYGLRTVCLDADEAVLMGGDGSLESVKVVCRPHRCRARELRWMAQQGNAKYNVSIDLFDVGVLLYNPKLSGQHFVLK